MTGRIRTYRDELVILDTDLALVVGLDVERLSALIRGRWAKIPREMAFEISGRELEVLEPPLVGDRANHLAITEHGTVLVAGVLEDLHAAQEAIKVVWAFAALRDARAAASELSSHNLGSQRRLH